MTNLLSLLLRAAIIDTAICLLCVLIFGIVRLNAERRDAREDARGIDGAPKRRGLRRNPRNQSAHDAEIGQNCLAAAHDMEHDPTLKEAIDREFAEITSGLATR